MFYTGAAMVRLRRNGSVSWVGHLLWAVLLVPIPGHAQDRSAPSPGGNTMMPACGPHMDGQVICESGVVYECQFIDPKSLERRTGWRWKSDLLRGCAEPVPVIIDRRSDWEPDEMYLPRESDGRFRHDPRRQGGSVYPPGTNERRPRGWTERDRDRN